MRSSSAAWCGVCLTLAVFLRLEVHAQAWAVDVAFDQSFTSLDPLPSPTGVMLTAGGLRQWGPLGFQVSFRSVSEGGGTIAQRCTFASCVPGPFDQTHAMRTLGLGLSLAVPTPADVWLTLLLGATANWLVERLHHVRTGERSTVGSGVSDLGIASAVHLRLRPLVLGLRPEIALHYDRVFARECAADAACWTGGDVFGFSAGLGWVVGAAPGG